jgi:hypothetical protein
MKTQAIHSITLRFLMELSSCVIHFGEVEGECRFELCFVHVNKTCTIEMENVCGLGD